MGLRDWGLGALGLGFQASGLGAWGLVGFRAFGIGVWGFGFGLWGLWLGFRGASERSRHLENFGKILGVPPES